MRAPAAFALDAPHARPAPGPTLVADLRVGGLCALELPIVAALAGDAEADIEGGEGVGVVVGRLQGLFLGVGPRLRTLRHGGLRHLRVHRPHGPQMGDG